METINVIITIVTLLIMCLISIEDFFRKEVSILWLSCFLILIIFYFLFFNSWFYINFTINISILFFLHITMKTYSMFKNGKNEKIINRTIGLGDIIIASIFALVFTPINFLIFLNISFIIGILYYLIFKKKSNKIPLAGIFSGVYFLLILISIFNKVFTIVFLDDIFN